MSIRAEQFLLLSAWLLLASCGDREIPTSPDMSFDANGSVAVADSRHPTTLQSAGAAGNVSTDPALDSSSSSVGGTVKETLTGPAINGVVPQGEAIADQSSFLSGGSTILTVQVRDVNLPSGTVLGVTLDFTPIGTITLSGGEGSMTANLGHFGVSRDQVRVQCGDGTILQGGFFR